MKKEKQKDPNRLIDENGVFKSEFPGGPGTGVTSLGYLEDLCEYLYYFGIEEKPAKLKRIKELEEWIQKIINGEVNEGDKPLIGIKAEYHPTWSIKLINT